MLDKQSEYELKIFKSFVTVCGLPIITESIEKRNPLEPDIKCSVEGGGNLYFELTQLIDSNFANMLSKQNKIKKELHKYYDNELNAGSRGKFSNQYSDAIIFIPFENSLSFEKRKKLFPFIFEHLLSLNDKFQGKTLNGDPGFKGKLKYIYVDRGINGPIFDDVPVSTIGDPTIPALKAKFENKYPVDDPLHLLAYIDINPMPLERVWIPKAMDYARQNIGKSQFVKLWIFDLHNKIIKFCYP